MVKSENEKRIDSLLGQMNDLYIKFCWPRIIVNTETSEVEFSYAWTSEDAHKMFDTIQEELTRCLIEQHRLEAEHAKYYQRIR